MGLFTTQVDPFDPILRKMLALMIITFVSKHVAINEVNVL
jgi:hypothetical protein